MLKNTVLAATVLAALTTTAPAALARGGNDRPEVRAAGSCGSATSAKLKLKADDGAIEIEWEVDRNRAGERWRVSLARDGAVTHRSVVRTAGPSGSFSYERRIADRPGADRVTARATGPGGVTCTATATLTA